MKECATSNDGIDIQELGLEKDGGLGLDIGLEGKDGIGSVRGAVIMCHTDCIFLACFDDTLLIPLTQYMQSLIITQSRSR